MDRPFAGYTLSLTLWIAVSVVGCGKAVLEQTHEARVIRTGDGEITVESIRPIGSDQDGSRTYPVRSDARITKDGKGAKLKDLEPGDFVNLRTKKRGDRESVTEIEARTDRPEKKEPAKE